MAKATAAKDKDKKDEGGHTTTTTMTKGKYAKYENLFSNNPQLHVEDKLKDLTEKSATMSQAKNRCASGYLCKCGNIPLATRHRCIICAFCLHPECGVELKETSQHKVPSTNINQVCAACVTGGDLKKFVKNGELSLGLFGVHKYIRSHYPGIVLVEGKGTETHVVDTTYG